jgi:hypothetical protein
MNQTKHLQNISAAITEFSTNVGTIDLSNLASNQTDMKTSLSTIAGDTTNMDTNIQDIETNTSTANTTLSTINTNTTNIPNVIHTSGTLTDPFVTGTTKIMVMAGAQLDTKFAPITLSNTGYVQNDIAKIAGTGVSVNSGTKDAGCQRVVIATDDVNLSAINTTNTTLAGAVSSSKMNNNISSVAGTTISVNSGVKDNGCVRVCGASDDTSWSKLSVLTNAQYTFPTGLDKSISVCNRESSISRQCGIGIGIARHDGVDTSVIGYNAFIATGSGNISAAPTYTGSGDNKDTYACPRVVIATDDVNLSAMKTDLDNIYTKVTAMEANIQTMTNILAAVYVPGTTSLKTST